MRAVVIVALCLALAGCSREAAPTAGVEAAVAETRQPERRPIFQRLFNPTPQPTPTAPPDVQPTQTPSAPQADTPTPNPTPAVAVDRPQRPNILGRIFGGGTPSPTQAAVETPAVPLTFGLVQKACGTPQSAMGREIDRHIGYAVFDTKPGATQPRTLYITGFRDRCPRKVMGTITNFGSTQGHEFLRYRSNGAYSQADLEYERIKGRICRVPDRQPCNNRRQALDRQTTFLTVYRTFGSSVGRKTLLLHRGNLVAVDQ